MEKSLNKKKYYNKLKNKKGTELSVLTKKTLKYKVLFNHQLWINKKK